MYISSGPSAFVPCPRLHLYVLPVSMATNPFPTQYRAFLERLYTTFDESVQLHDLETLSKSVNQWLDVCTREKLLDVAMQYVSSLVAMVTVKARGTSFSAVHLPCTSALIQTPWP